MTGGRFRRLISGGVPRILLGSLIGQGTLLGVSPLLTRLYSPADFGALAAFTAFATVLGGIATLSWERGIVIPRSELSARALGILGVLSALLVSALLTLLTFLAAPFIDDALGIDVFVRFWWLLPLTTLAMGGYAVLSATLVRSKAYGRLAARNAVQGVSQAASSVLFGVFGAGPIGLLSGILVGRIASVIGVVRLGRRSDRMVRMLRLRAVARRYRRFPLVSSGSRLLNSLGLQLPALFIVALYGSVEAGLYALTIRVLATPIGIVVDAVSQYFEGTFAGRLRDRSAGLSGLVSRTAGRLAVIAVLPTVAVLSFGPAIFEWVFGARWQLAGVFAQITVVYYAAQFIVAPISRTLVVLERQLTQLVWDVSRMLATSIAVLVPALVGATLTEALFVLSASQFALYGVLYVLCIRAAHAAEGGLTARIRQ